MKLEGIGVAENGFILHDSYGKTYIAKTLAEAAMIAGENISSTSYTIYAQGYTINDLIEVNGFARNGKKIDAIKLLRECFSPRLGLREAKDIVEQLRG